MEEKLLDEVLYCLRGERTLYHYHPDRYAIYLLQRLLSKESHVKISSLRKSHLARLLNRPALQELVAKSGNGHLDSSVLSAYGCAVSEPYVLTVGKWGDKKNWSWNQTSRPGGNLVLQLNLSETWSRGFYKVANSQVNNFFDCGHPISSAQCDVSLG